MLTIENYKAIKSVLFYESITYRPLWQIVDIIEMDNTYLIDVKNLADDTWTEQRFHLNRKFHSKDKGYPLWLEWGVNGIAMECLEWKDIKSGGEFMRSLNKFIENVKKK